MSRFCKKGNFSFEHAHIETSRLFCSAKQINGFYLKRNIGLKQVNSGKSLKIVSEIKIKRFCTILAFRIRNDEELHQQR